MKKSPAPPPSRSGRRLPARRLPLLYFAFGHACLAAVFVAFAVSPATFAGFFYHPRMLAAVHLVTLGWISGSILGALHLVGPMALRMPMPERRSDFWVFTAFVLAATGVVSHFWIEQLAGVGHSGMLLMLVFGQVAWKFLGGLRDAKVPSAVKLYFRLAFFNLGAAALAGTLFGLNRADAFLPGFSMYHAYAHAHLAAIGWATMMVFGAAYRLLPMLLPSAMPAGRGILAGALILETGVLGLFVSLLVGGRGAGLFATVVLAGIAIFFVQVAWMLRHRKRPPKDRRWPDYGVVQAMLAFAYLAVTAVLGWTLAVLPSSEHSFRLAWIYGICGLIGFLSQIVVGISHRLLPWFSWLGAYSASDWTEVPPSPQAMPDRRLQALTTLLWALGVPALAAGFYLDRLDLIRLAGALLAAAVLAGAASNIAVLRVMWRRPDPSGAALQSTE